MGNDSMRRAFLLNENNQPVSALVSKDQSSAMSVGVGVRVLADINLGAQGIIYAGAKGWVEWCDPENGSIEVLMEGLEPALHEWNNILILVPFETDDIIGCLQCSPARAGVHHVKTRFKASTVEAMRQCSPSTDIPQ